MKIEHIAIWTKDPEAMKNFCVKYFMAHAGEKYNNPTRKFQSCLKYFFLNQKEFNFWPFSKINP